MGAWYWIFWAVLTTVNFGAYYFWMCRFAGWERSVMYRGRRYTIVEQSWDLETDTFQIRAEAR